MARRGKSIANGSGIKFGSVSRRGRQVARAEGDRQSWLAGRIVDLGGVPLLILLDTYSKSNPGLHVSLRGPFACLCSSWTSRQHPRGLLRGVKPLARVASLYRFRFSAPFLQPTWQRPLARSPTASAP